MTSDPDSDEVVASLVGTGPVPTIKSRTNPGPRSARSHSHALAQNRGGSSHSAMEREPRWRTFSFGSRRGTPCAHS